LTGAAQPGSGGRTISPSSSIQITFGMLTTPEQRVQLVVSVDERRVVGARLVDPLARRVGPVHVHRDRDHLETARLELRA
jgi:hypothetical protein